MKLVLTGIEDTLSLPISISYSSSLASRPFIYLHQTGYTISDSEHLTTPDDRLRNLPGPVI